MCLKQSRCTDCIGWSNDPAWKLATVFQDISLSMRGEASAASTVTAPPLLHSRPPESIHKFQAATVRSLPSDVRVCG
eukprot:g14742.t1